MFLSTRDYHYLYKFIVGSSKKNCENLVKKKLELLLFNKKKLTSLMYLFFFTYIILSGKIFKKDRALIKFDGIEIGRFVLSKTFCDFECFTNKLKFYKVLIKNFFYAGTLLSTCDYYYKKFSIKGAYVDHCGYLNGIIFSFFARKGIPVYTNNYPLGIYFVDYRKNKKKYLLKYENSLRISVKKNIDKFKKKQAEKKIVLMMKKKNFIPYLAKMKYKKFKNINYEIFDYVVYAHSFTDGQLWYGYAGFENTLEWLELTLDKFINTKKNVLIKPHPNFYSKSLGPSVILDKKIYDRVVQKYTKHKNLYFLDKPTHNYLLLKKLNKDCILITKYGTSIMEAAYMNFKSICSASNFFDRKFKISNMWEGRTDYTNLLNLDNSKLKRPDKNDLLKLVYALFYFYNSEYHINFFNNIIRRNLKLTKDDFKKKILSTGRTKISNSKIIKINKYTKLKENKIINEISNTIYQVKI